MSNLDYNLYVIDLQQHNENISEIVTDKSEYLNIIDSTDIFNEDVTLSDKLLEKELHASIVKNVYRKYYIPIIAKIRSFYIREYSIETYNDFLKHINECFAIYNISFTNASALKIQFMKKPQEESDSTHNERIGRFLEEELLEQYTDIILEIIIFRYTILFIQKYVK